MFIDNQRISDTLKKYGINLGHLIKFLQDKQIPVEVIGNVLPEIIQELEEGKQWYKESLMYPPNYRQHMQEFPDDFWIDNYILERCRMFLDEIVGGDLPLNKDQSISFESLKDIVKTVSGMNKQLVILKQQTKYNEKIAMGIKDIYHTINNLSQKINDNVTILMSEASKSIADLADREIKPKRENYSSVNIENKIYQLDVALKYLMRDTDILIANASRPSWLRRLWTRLNEPIWSRQTWVWTRNGWHWMEKPKKKKKRKWMRSQ